MMITALNDVVSVIRYSSTAFQASSTGSSFFTGWVMQHIGVWVGKAGALLLPTFHCMRPLSPNLSSTAFSEPILSGEPGATFQVCALDQRMLSDDQGVFSFALADENIHKTISYRAGLRVHKHSNQYQSCKDIAAAVGSTEACLNFGRGHIGFGGLHVSIQEALVASLS